MNETSSSTSPAPARTIAVYVVLLPIFEAGPRKIEAFVKKSDAAARFRAVVAELKALAKCVREFPKGAAPGEAPPRVPLFGDVHLYERRYERERLGPLLAKSLNGTLSPHSETPLRSFSFQNPNAPKSETSSPAAPSGSAAS